MIFSYKKGKFGHKTVAQKESNMKAYKEKIARGSEQSIYISRNPKDCWQPPEAKRSQKGFSSRAVRESMVLLTPWLWTCSLQNMRQYISIVSGYPVFGMTALGN